MEQTTTAAEIAPISPTAAIKRYFESDGGRKVDLQEFKSLSPADKTELATLAAAALGAPLQEVATA